MLWLFISKVEGCKRKDRIKKKIVNEELHKYFIKNQLDENYKEISYSYCDEYIVCAISSENKIGVDMENQQYINTNKAGVSIIFRKDSSKLLTQSNLTLIWTIHEAIGKFEGVGLYQPIELQEIKKINIKKEKIEILNRKEIYKLKKYHIKYLFAGEKKNIYAYSCEFLSYMILVVKKGEGEHTNERKNY